MKLCECGCEKEVKKLSSKYCQGHASRVKEIKEKKKQTCLEHYGVENPNQSKEIKEKKKQTCLEHYGVANPSQSEKIQDQIKYMCLEKYGVESTNKIENIKEKKKQTCLEHYGVANPSQSENIKQKVKESHIKKYGGFTFQSKELRNKAEHTCKEKYGHKKWSCTDKGRLQNRINAIKRIENQRLNGNILMPNVGILEQICLNELQKLTVYYIIRNQLLIGYFPDGYIKELNLVIEFDERYHFLDYYKNYKEKDIQKNLDYQKEQLTIFRIKKIDWLNRKEDVIKEFQEILSGRIN
jgi:very-short-patch-repair endonuclease